ncbi:MAG: AAA family ATPase [Campylobacterota bacterium]|nr:AAA family ATPase [Campylobacterota bacterium]
MLDIKLNNLGNIKEANIKLNKLTIFCGENNSGKTYLNYVLYELLDKRFTLRNDIFTSIVKDTKENGSIKLDINEFINNNFEKIRSSFEKHFEKSLDRFFSTTQGSFKDFKLNINQTIEETQLYCKDIRLNEELSIGKNNNTVCEITKEDDTNIIIIIKDIDLPDDMYIEFISNLFFKFIFPYMFHDTFLLPAERTGLNLFYQELNINRNALINHLQKSKINPLDVIKDLIVSKYPQPIADYIEFLNDTVNLKKKRSEFRELNNILHNKIIKGKYQVSSDGISFLPYKTYFKGNEYQSKIDLHMASSTVKTFFSLEFYLEHMAVKGAYLIIDEPELNLHPDNQRKTARLISQIVNAGVNVIISTHSDYIIRELNNLIMLKSDFNSKDKLMNQYNYKEDELLCKDDVYSYLLKDGEVKPMNITENDGIIAKTFDDVINKLNSSSDDIYYTKMEDLEDE